MKTWQIVLVVVGATLVVGLAIVGVLIALVGPNVYRAMVVDNADVAETQMSNIGTAIKMYYLDNREVPASLGELMQADPRTGQPYMESIPRDPWDQPYELRDLGGGNFELRSPGPDTMEGTEDDVLWPRRGAGR